MSIWSYAQGRSPFFRLAISLSAFWLIGAIACALLVPDARNHLMWLGRDAVCGGHIDSIAQIDCHWNLSRYPVKTFLRGAWIMGLPWVIAPIAVLMTIATFGGRYVQWVKGAERE